MPHDAAAQRLLSEVTLRYRVTVSSPGTNQPAAGFDSISYIISLKGGQSRTEMISSLGSESTIYDPRTASGYIIKEYGGTRLLINAGPEDWLGHNRTFHDLVFSTESGNFTVGSIQCKKGSARLPSGKMVTVLYDPAMVLPNYDYHLAFSGLKGLPVSFELEQGGLIYKYEMTSMSADPISYSRFQVPGKGYRILSYEELKKMGRDNK
jgi:hypothetical protein